MNKTFFAGGTFWYGVGIIGALFFGKVMFLTCCWGLLLMFIGARENEGGNKETKCKDCKIEEDW